MSMVNNLVETLRKTANAYAPTDKELYKLLSNAAFTIAELSMKSQEMRAVRISDGAVLARVQINNLPTYPLDKYIVTRVDGTELWFYGTYEDSDFALKVAEEIGNGIVLERG